MSSCLRAVRKHVRCAWALLYIERWLTAPMVQEDGTIIERSRGTPQGGVVSPILANLFMHYAFDLWMARTFPDLRRLSGDRCSSPPINHSANGVKSSRIEP